MSDDKSELRDLEVYDAIQSFLRTRRCRFLAERLGIQLTEETTQEFHHELFVRLASNAGFMERVQNAREQTEIVRLVCFYCRNFYLRNIVRDSRAGKRHYRTLDPQKLEENTAADRTLPAKVQFALKLLPDLQQRLIELRLSGFTQREIALRLGLDERRLSSLHRSALQSLRTILSDTNHELT